MTTSIQDKKRRTGRTTRMLRHAEQLSNEGRAVYVVGLHREHVASLRRQAEDLGLDLRGIAFETEATLGNLEWFPMPHLRGAHPNVVVLADHYTIEMRFGSLFTMMQAYDEPNPEPKYVRQHYGEGELARIAKLVMEEGPRATALASKDCETISKALGTIAAIEADNLRRGWRESAARDMLKGLDLDRPDGCTKDDNIAALCFRAAITIGDLRKKLGR